MASKYRQGLKTRNEFLIEPLCSTTCIVQREVINLFEVDVFKTEPEFQFLLSYISLNVVEVGEHRYTILKGMITLILTATKRV